MNKKNDWVDKIYQIVKQIPKGKITTYGAIAQVIGTTTSARMVGWVLNKSHTLQLPAHRVVNRNGVLTGKMHFATPTLMQELLEQEGIKIKDDKIINFKSNLWQPLPSKTKN